MSDIGAETVSHGLDAGWVEAPIGTAMRIRSQGPDRAAKGVSIRAPGAADEVPNTSTVYVGTRANLTADRSAGSVALPPGMAITLPVSDPSEIFCIATESGQYLNWMSL